MEEIQFTRAEQKEARQIMAELTHASCHLGLILNSCLLQWKWGLKGGKPGEEDEYPPIPDGAFRKAQVKRIMEQLITVDTYNWKLLKKWGISGKRNTRHNIVHSTNEKVAILNACLKKYGPPVRCYADDLIIQTAVLQRCLSGLREAEKHNDKNWKLLCQTVETLVKRTEATPLMTAYADKIYHHVKPYMLGMKALCDWEE